MLVDHLRALQPATDYIAALEDRPACSEISRIEIIQGLRSAERQRAEALFELIEWIAVSETIARRAGELGRRWRRSHPGIGVADLAIAASAELAEASLVTGNVRHFPMFPDLRSPY